MTSTLKRHAALVDTMAQVRGVDLEEQALRGNVDIQDISDAVLSCTGCANPGECQGWLARNAAGSDSSPSYCRNTDLFDRLAVR